MSNFWANRLGTQPQAAPQPPPAPATNAPWWMPQQTVAAPQQAPPPLQPQAQPSSVTPAEGATFSDALTQEGYTSTKAQSARDPERCPECDGPNYLAEKGKQNSMKHCFDCGHNPRFSQSMAGMSGVGQNIPVKTARVQNVATGSPPMGTVIAHL